MASHEDFQRLLVQAEELPDGPPQVAVIEQAVRYADAHLEIEWQFFARLCLIGAAFTGGCPDSLLVAISWCLGVVDRHQDAESRFDCYALLWKCKHALAYAPSYLEISYGQFQNLLQDVLARYRRLGASPRSVYFIAMSGEFWMGHVEAGQACYQQAQKHPQDRFAETPAWELYFDIEQLFQAGREADALAKLAPMLADPAAAEDVDSWFVHYALIPLVKEGRLREAAVHQRRAYRKVAHNPKFTDHVGHHMLFRTLLGDFSTALAMFESHVQLVLDSPTAATRFAFWLDSWFLFNQMLEAGHTATALRLPEPLQQFADGGHCDLRRLAEWLDSETHDLAEKFDQRNDNRYISGMIDTVQQYAQWMQI